MNPCPGSDWDPVAGYDAYSALEGLLAGFVFSGIVFLIATQAGAARRIRTLMMFVSAFVVLAFASYLSALSGGETVCLRAWSVQMVSSGLLGLGAVNIFVGIAWLLDTYVGGDDRSQSLKLLLVLSVVGTAAVVATLLPITVNGYWQDSYPSQSAWVGRGLLIYGVVTVTALVALVGGWLRSTAKIEPSVDGAAGGLDVAPRIDRALRVSTFASALYAVVSSIAIGVVINIPRSQWDPLPYRWLPAALGGAALLIPTMVVLAQVAGLPPRHTSINQPGKSANPPSSGSGGLAPAIRTGRRRRAAHADTEEPRTAAVVAEARSTPAPAEQSPVPYFRPDASERRQVPNPEEDPSDPLKRVRERVEDQAHSHWHEFAVIVASANVLLALVLYGRIIATAHANTVTYFAIAIALTSTLAAMFAYYSIQVGILFVVGPLRLAEVLVSFLIAAVQLALFLWPTHVLSVESRTAEVEFKGLRQWLIFIGLFAFPGPLANWYAARTRRLRNPTLVVNEYESSQRRDRNVGWANCVLVMICWALSFRWLTLSLAAGITISMVGLTFGIVSQERVAKQIVNSLDEPASAGADRSPN